jgi:hypothetical protein
MRQYYLDQLDPATKKFVFPLPGEGKGAHLGTVQTDDRGMANIDLTPLEVGRYTIKAKGLQSGREAFTTIQVLPPCKSRGQIRTYNRMVQNSIQAAANEQEVSSWVEKSRLAYSLSEGRLKKSAEKEYQQTCEIANRRLQELMPRMNNNILNNYGSINGSIVQQGSAGSSNTTGLSEKNIESLLSVLSDIRAVLEHMPSGEHKSEREKLLAEIDASEKELHSNKPRLQTLAPKLGTIKSLSELFVVGVSIAEKLRPFLGL